MGANCGFGRKPAYAYVLYHATAQSDRKKGTRQAIYTHTSIRKHHASLSSSVMSPQTKNVCNSTALTIDAEATAQPIYVRTRTSWLAAQSDVHSQHQEHNCHNTVGTIAIFHEEILKATQKAKCNLQFGQGHQRTQLPEAKLQQHSWHNCQKHTMAVDTGVVSRSSGLRPTPIFPIRKAARTISAYPDTHRGPWL